MLDVLGLDRAEERAYRQLIELPSGDADDLARLLGVDWSHAAALLTALEAKGLVARTTSGRDQYVASPPAVALGALVVQRQEELKRAQLELAALTETYRGGSRRRSVHDAIDVVLGPEAVGQRFLQLHRTAQAEIQALVKSDVSVVAPEENPDERAAIARGVQYQVVVERGLLDREGFFESAAESIRAGVEARVARSLPLRMIIVDRALALVPLLPGRDNDPAGGALLIHPSGLLDGLQALFDLVWEASPALAVDSRSVGDSEDARLDELDAQVLSLLFAGLTDQAVGRQLGLSLRTVQRRVRLLMDRADVETRLQLGHAACRRGWL